MTLREAKSVATTNELFACAAPQAYPVEQYRKDFPILSEKIHGQPLAYLDNAASTQKPRMVLDAMQRFMEHDYANIHRGVHELSVRATDRYEAARESVRRLLNARRAEEIVFVRNGTEAINLVAASWGRKNLKAGDEVVLTILEHHSNIVPWQMLRDLIGFTIKVIPMTESGDITLENVKATLSPRTRMLAFTHVSNVLGTVLPVADMIKMAHDVGAVTLIDGCQAVARMPVDVRALDSDFYVLSGHKIYGPSGIGALYGKYGLLESMPPYMGGGGMIASVTFEETTYREPPFRFEAGTPAITEAVGLGAAIDYVTTIGLNRIARHEDDMMAYAVEKLRGMNSVQILGSPQHRTGALSFTMSCAHPHDIGTILDRHGVAIRAGHHCAQPLMERLGVPATARISFGLMNTTGDIDRLIEAIGDVQRIFA